MNAPTERTLWIGLRGNRHFLIPAQAALPPGDFGLKNSSGDVIRVDPTALVPFEVEAQVGRAHLLAQMSQALDQVQPFIAQLPQTLPPTKSTTTSDVAQDERVRLILDRLGISLKDVIRDPRLGREALDDLLRDFSPQDLAELAKILTYLEVLSETRAPRQPERDELDPETR